MHRQIILASLVALLAGSGAALSAPARFDTPETAVAAVIAALEAADRNAVLEIFGPENEDVLSTGNSVQDKQIGETFCAM